MMVACLFPSSRDLAWVGTETNEFGTDEFMRWCEAARTEPYLALNMGTGTLDEALGWVEYCNLDGDTHYAAMRRRNGREKPYNVRCARSNRPLRLPHPPR
jgi:alpha-N-arabinofuranosidase